jgi:hypothetical protein
VTSNASKATEILGLSYIGDGQVKWHSHSGEKMWQFLTKLNMYLKQNSVIILVGMYTREIKTCVPRQKKVLECS